MGIEINLNYYSLIPILFAYFIINYVIHRAYLMVSIKKSIYAQPNSRSSHYKEVPQGSGIIFSISIFSVCLILLELGLIKSFYLHISLIAMIVSIFGFFDDLLNFRALLKLIFQIFIAIITVFSFEFNTFFGFENIPKVIQYATYVFFITWAMNAYNFLDGIDGYASVGILISSFFVLLLMSSNLPLEFLIFLVLILINVLAFILLNWPPAKIFMGDAGSLYLGYVFSIIIIYTIDRNFIALDFWLLSLSFYISDILITQILRIALLRKWYVGHRSHAYQNFARIHSHKAMLYVYTLFMFFWVLPLLVANMSYPDYSLFILIIGFLPSVIFSIKYGPLLSLD